MTSRNATQLLPLADQDAARFDRSISDIAHVLLFGAIGWPRLARSLPGGRAQRNAP